MQIETSDYVTVRHAAEIADVSEFWVRQLLTAEPPRLDGCTVDGVQFVLRASAEQFVRHPSAGRPSGDRKRTKKRR